MNSTTSTHGAARASAFRDIGRVLLGLLLIAALTLIAPAAFAHPATAQVQKTTIPKIGTKNKDYWWTFTLSGPGGVSESVQAGAGAAYVPFTAKLWEEGTYTVTETPRKVWDLNQATPNDGVDVKTCSFTVNYPADEEKVFSCDFINTKRGKVKVNKTVSGLPLADGQAFTFQLRQGASEFSSGTILGKKVANFLNHGIAELPVPLVPGETYQLCEIIMPGWDTTLDEFVPGSFMPPDGAVPNPGVDNSIVCIDVSVEPSQNKEIPVDNTPPPGGVAHTIGFWKNWSSCSKSKGGQAPVLDQTLASFPVAAGESTAGVHVGDLYVDTCVEAVRLLDKSTVDSGQKKASDPAFNMAAQLMAAVLNIRADAATCPAANDAIAAGQALLDLVDFDGLTHAALTAQQATDANGLGTTLDQYNNNALCP